MDTEQLELAPFVSGLGFAEAPRWHDGALWLSDITERRVLRVDANARVETVTRTPGEPSGLGWLPDGSLLIVQMEEHELWRYADGVIRHHCSTAAVSRIKLNDMIVDRNGRAWVSNFGFDHETETPRTTALVGIEPDGQVITAAEELWCPNGMAIDAAGKLLFVGQSASSAAGVSVIACRPASAMRLPASSVAPGAGRSTPLPRQRSACMRHTTPSRAASSAYRLPFPARGSRDFLRPDGVHRAVPVRRTAGRGEGARDSPPAGDRVRAGGRMHSIAIRTPRKRTPCIIRSAGAHTWPRFPTSA